MGDAVGQIMLSLRALALVFGTLLGLTIALATVGNFVAPFVKHPEALEAPAKIVFFGLFLALGFTAIPLMMQLFFAGQRLIGNESRFVPPAQVQVAIVWLFWGLIAAGLALALPAAIASGFFGRGGAVALERIAAGKSQGLLTANVGMTAAEIRLRSTLALGDGTRAFDGSTTFVGKGVFDFHVAGTGIAFERCRYYLISTRGRRDPRVETVSVGISPEKLTKAELLEAERATRERLAHDGWRSGRFVYRTEEDRRLHGGVKEGGAGTMWLHGDAVLLLGRKRMDDPVTGESADAGEWIQTLDLSARNDFLRLNPTAEFADRP